MPPDGQHGPIVLTCGPRDFHSVGLDAMAAMLRQRGWACPMLGVLTPAVSLRLAVHESDAVAVVLVSHLSWPAARRSRRSAASSDPEPACSTPATPSSPGRLATASRDYLGTDLSQAADLISAYVAADYDGEG